MNNFVECMGGRSSAAAAHLKKNKSLPIHRTIYKKQSWKKIFSRKKKLIFNFLQEVCFL